MQLSEELVTAVLILQIPGVHFEPREDTSDGCCLYYKLRSQECGRAGTSLELCQSALGLCQCGVGCFLSLLPLIFVMSYLGLT